MGTNDWRPLSLFEATFIHSVSPPIIDIQRNQWIDTVEPNTLRIRKIAAGKEARRARYRSYRGSIITVSRTCTRWPRKRQTGPGLRSCVRNSFVSVAASAYQPWRCSRVILIEWLHSTPPDKGPAVIIRWNCIVLPPNGNATCT